MAELVLFHHVQGLTPGVLALADEFRSAGHTVHAPDLFDGELPASIEDGVKLVQALGDEELARRADAAVEALPSELIYGGISFGVSQAQRLAQRRPGALGALLYEACIPVTGEWSFGPWPDRVASQIHGMAQDPFFALEGDIDAARELVATIGPERAELFVYEGNKHLFTDSSLESYDEEATRLVIERSKHFLDRVG